MEAVGYLGGDDPTNPDPPGGQLLRDDQNNLIGVVTENAQQRLREAAFPPTDANKDVAFASLQSALRTLRENGITTVSDAGGFWRQAQTEAWQRALEEDILTGTSTFARE